MIIDQSILPLVINLVILITFTLDDLLMLFGEKPKSHLGRYRIMIIGDDVAVVGDKDGDVDNKNGDPPRWL